MSEVDSPSVSSPPEPASTPGWARALALVLLGAVLSFWAWSPVIGNYPKTQNGDGQYFHRITEAARVSVLRYHELPLWNPFECGGVPLWDNPQSIIAAPVTWFLLPFDVTRAMELWYVVHSIIGFIGMWLFARHDLKLTRFGTFFAAVVWTFSGFHQHHYSGGHAAFVSFLYLPIALLLWRRAAEDHRFAVGVGLLFAWMIFEGAVYPLPHFGVCLAAESLTRAWPPRRFGRIVRAGVIVGVVALVVGAARFLPVMAQLKAHTRPLGVEADHVTWKTLSDMFTIRQHGRFVEGQEYVWTEYATYVGPVVLVLAAFGLAVAGIEYAWLYALLIFSAALMLGHFAHLAPWSILKGHVFPFKEMRVPSRFRLETSFFLIAFASLAIDRIAPPIAKGFSRIKRMRPAIPRWSAALHTVVIAIALMGAGDVIGVAIDTHGQFFHSPPTKPAVPSPRLYLGGPGLADFLDQPRQNRGRVECWDEWGFGAGAPVWTGDVPQARAQGPGAIVEVANRTQNTFTIDVNVTEPSTILINSTFDRGWRTNIGDLVEVNRQLALALPPGQHRVQLKYWPAFLTLGLWLTCLGTLVCAVWLVRPRTFQFLRFRRRSSATSRTAET